MTNPMTTSDGRMSDETKRLHPGTLGQLRNEYADHRLWLGHGHYVDVVDLLDEIDRLRSAAGEVERMREALERASKLIPLLTVRQVISAGDDAIEAAGLNPWAMNEGLATGDENISADFTRRALAGSAT